MSGGAPRLAAELAESGQASWLERLTSILAAGGKTDALLGASEIDKVIRDSKGRLQLRQVIELFQKWMVDLSLAGNGLPIRYSYNFV